MTFGIGRDFAEVLIYSLVSKVITLPKVSFFFLFRKLANFNAFVIVGLYQ